MKTSELKRGMEIALAGKRRAGLKYVPARRAIILEVGGWGTTIQMDRRRRTGKSKNVKTRHHEGHAAAIHDPETDEWEPKVIYSNQIFMLWDQYRVLFEANIRQDAYLQAEYNEIKASFKELGVDILQKGPFMVLNIENARKIVTLVAELKERLPYIDPHGLNSLI